MWYLEAPARVWVTPERWRWAPLLHKWKAPPTVRVRVARGRWARSGSPPRRWRWRWAPKTESQDFLCRWARGRVWVAPGAAFALGPYTGGLGHPPRFLSFSPLPPPFPFPPSLLSPPPFPPLLPLSPSLSSPPPSPPPPLSRRYAAEKNFWGVGLELEALGLEFRALGTTDVTVGVGLCRRGRWRWAQKQTDGGGSGSPGGVGLGAPRVWVAPAAAHFANAGGKEGSKVDTVTGTGLSTTATALPEGLVALLGRASPPPAVPGLSLPLGLGFGSAGTGSPPCWDMAAARGHRGSCSGRYGPCDGGGDLRQWR